MANYLDDDKLDEFSQFKIASITKIFASYLILILAEKGLLKTSDKVDKYIKSTKKNDFSKITILNLMNHRSNLQKDVFLETYEKFTSISSFIHKILQKKLFMKSTTSKPTYSYSNLGYILLGYIIEMVTDATYIEAFDKFVFKPLKLKHTTFGEKLNVKSFYLHSKKLKKQKILEISHFSSTAYGMTSCIADFITFSVNIKNLSKKSKNTLKKLYFCVKGDGLIIEHNGGFDGISANLSIQFDWDFVMHAISAELITNHLF